jgi:hypothetical protein
MTAQRIWLYLKTSTVALAIDALKRVSMWNHGKESRISADAEDEAAEDLKHAQRLGDADTHATREDIENASKRHDEGEDGS